MKNNLSFFGRDQFSNSIIVKTKENLKGKIKEAIITGGIKILYLAKFMRRQKKRTLLLKYVRTNEIKSKSNYKEN